MYFRLGILFASLFLIIGCQQNDDQDHALPTENQNNKIVNVKNSDPRERADLTNGQIADHLANVASDVPEVNDAVSVVVGPYAVVGIDVDKELDRSRVGTIKYSVTEALRHDPYGKTAVVVADGDVTERIRGMADKIQQGYPIQGVVDEVAAIVARYMPDFPIPEGQPEEQDQNKQIMDNEEEQELDNIQNEQSNQHKEKNVD